VEVRAEEKFQGIRVIPKAPRGNRKATKPMPGAAGVNGEFSIC
jgi:hypothetical protein